MCIYISENIFDIIFKKWNMKSYSRKDIRHHIQEMVLQNVCVRQNRIEMFIMGEIHNKMLIGEWKDWENEKK